MENKENNAMNNKLNQKENKVPFRYKWDDDERLSEEPDSHNTTQDTVTGDVQSIEKSSKATSSIATSIHPYEKGALGVANTLNTDSSGNNASLDMCSQTPDSLPSYIYRDAYVPIDMCYDAGLGWSGAQAINRRICVKDVDLYYKHMMYAEEINHMMAVAECKRAITENNDIAFDKAGNMIPIPKKKRVNLREAESSFIKKQAVVKVRSRYLPKWFFMSRSKYYNRHVVISDQDLEQDYYDFLDDYLPDESEISQSAKSDSFRRMKRAVLKLQDSKLEVLKGHEIMFLDGIYNVRTNEFRPIPYGKMIQFFNMFSIEINYGSGQGKNPDVFDAFLHTILDGNEDAIHGVYQMIGSILTPVGNLRKCHLLQGAASSGKTSLVYYIKRLMPIEDSLDMPNLSNITENSLIQSDQPVRLVHVCELGTSKLSAKQVVNLKAFADGVDDIPGVTSFKIILTTNHKVVTGKDGVIETALKNRLLVIPFPKPLDLENADPRVTSLDDVYFEQERHGIILKALRAYSEVLNSNGDFCCDFEVNAVVDEVENPDDHLSEDEKQLIKSGLPTDETSTPQVLAEIFDTAFTLVDEVNPNMTTKAIMNAVNYIRPGTLANEPSTGRRLQQHFGKSLKSCRYDGSTIYNLDFVRPSTEEAIESSAE